MTTMPSTDHRREANANHLILSPLEDFSDIDQARRALLKSTKFGALSAPSLSGGIRVLGQRTEGSLTHTC
jgi:hypothetical protein